MEVVVDEDSVVDVTAAVEELSVVVIAIVLGVVDAEVV